jgi:hypothetical protein
MPKPQIMLLAVANTEETLYTEESGAKLVTEAMLAGNSIVTPVDKSGTITTGGVAQTAIAANASRKGWVFQNISDTDMYLGEGVTATTGKFLVKANGGTASSGNLPATVAISVLCATTGKAFAATEYV